MAILLRGWVGRRSRSPFPPGRAGRARGGLAFRSVGPLLLSVTVFATTFGHQQPAAWTPNWLGGRAQVTHPPNPSYELEAFDPARVSYGPGGLRLSIREDPVTIDGIVYPYRSGAISGYQKQAYVYGDFSARIFVPCVHGQIVNWPAFWLVGDPYQWPATGEIDVFEGLAGHGWWHFHYRDSSGNPASDGGEAPGRYCGWHRFAVDWRPDAITWHYDGVLVGKVTTDITSSPMFPVFSYSVTDPGSAWCTQYPYACGGAIDKHAVMRVRDFTIRS